MEEATQQQDRQEEILDSIPGCGKALAAIISAEAGDIRRFDAAKRLKAYVGIDPLFDSRVTPVSRGLPNEATDSYEKLYSWPLALLASMTLNSKSITKKNGLKENRTVMSLLLLSVSSVNVFSPSLNMTVSM